jgi:uncharacterized protein YecE (DUF72 family)
MAWQMPPSVNEDLDTIARRLTKIDQSLVFNRGKIWTDEQKQVLAEFQFAIATLMTLVSDLVAVNDFPPRRPSSRRTTSAPA